jgi:ferric-dicitrate binding protein FerR (iron transport regulator)
LTTGPIPPDPEQLDRYLAGECSDIERHTIERWLREHPDDAMRLGVIAYVARYPVAGARERKDAAYAAFLTRIRAGAAADQPHAQPDIDRPHRSFGRRYARAEGGTSRAWRGSGKRLLAAAVVLAVVGAGSWSIVRHRSSAALDATAPAVWKTFATTHGQRLRIELPDGTRVLLAPASELRVRQAPADRTGEIVREVALSGEGFFDVAHMEGRPFAIHTPHGVVMQLGTSFDVRAYRGDAATRVAVTEGRVSLTPDASGTARRAAPPSRTSADAVVLAAGDFGEMTNAGVTNVARGIDVGQYTSWRRGELRFANTPLHDVIEELERWYDVKVILEDAAFADYRLTATLRQGSVDDVMDVVVKSLDLRVRRRGNTVWIVGTNAQPTKGP